MMRKQGIIHLVAFMISLPLLAQSLMDRIEIHGLISQGYILSSDNNYLNMKTPKGSYEMNEAAINFSTNITDRLRGGLQLLSRDLGKVGNNAVMLDWAYADYRFRDYLGFRIGKIKTPLALYNEIRDVDALRTFILLPQSVYDENVRDFSFAFQGIGIYGNVPLFGLGDVEYNLYTGAFNIPNPSSGFWYDSFSNLATGAEMVVANDSTTIEKLNITNSNVTADYIWGGSAYWTTPLEGLKLGGCYLYGSLYMSTDIAIFMKVTSSVQPGSNLYQSRQPNLDVDVKIKDYYTLSGEYAIQNLTLTGEYHSRIYRVHIRTSDLLGFPIDNDYQLIGYYGQATYRFTDWLEAGAYYSFYDDVDSHLEGTPSWYFTQKDICAAIRFDITPNLLIKFEGHKIDGVGLALSAENPSGRTQHWNLFAIKSSINF
ncbi:hypothetical protein ACFL4L_04210 [bacterium]